MSPLLVVRFRDWCVYVVRLQAFLRIYLMLVLCPCPCVFVLPWALDAFESVRAVARTKSLLPACVLSFCRRSTPLVVVRVRARVREPSTRVGPRARPLAPRHMMLHVASLRWKLG